MTEQTAEQRAERRAKQKAEIIPMLEALEKDTALAIAKAKQGLFAEAKVIVSDLGPSINLHFALSLAAEEQARG